MQHVVFCFCDNLINVWDYFVGAAAWQSQWVSYSGLILADKIKLNFLKKGLELQIIHFELALTFSAEFQKNCSLSTPFYIYQNLELLN